MGKYSRVIWSYWEFLGFVLSLRYKVEPVRKKYSILEESTEQANFVPGSCSGFWSNISEIETKKLILVKKYS